MLQHRMPPDSIYMYVHPLQGIEWILARPFSLFLHLSFSLFLHLSRFLSFSFLPLFLFAFLKVNLGLNWVSATLLISSFGFCWLWRTPTGRSKADLSPTLYIWKNTGLNTMQCLMQAALPLQRMEVCVFSVMLPSLFCLFLLSKTISCHSCPPFVSFFFCPFVLLFVFVVFLFPF